jgi:endonuclease YncB( thermonuclease family)
MAKTYGPYAARVDSLHDGDTVSLTIDLGFDFQIASHGIDGTPRLSCRVFGINAPELSTDAGKAALAYAQTLLPVATMVQVVSHGYDKYGGRFDGSITLPDGTDFGTAMIASGHAVIF